MKKFTFLLFLFLAFSANAQITIKQTKTDNDLKLSVLPYYNFGKGIGMTSPDSIFQLNDPNPVHIKGLILSETNSKYLKVPQNQLSLF